MEPADLWERYIDPEFRSRAPRRLGERRWDIRTLVEGEVMATMPGGDWPAHTNAEEDALARRYAEEIARNFDPETQVRAMDKEGLDLAMLAARGIVGEISGFRQDFLTALLARCRPGWTTPW